MHPVYLFIGQSGSGKGTQVSLLKEQILKNDPETKLFSIETGDKFRELIQSTSYTSRLTRDMIAAGTLPPAFLGVHMWSHELIDDYDGTTTVFIDGTPRVEEEVPLLLSAAEFYGWTIDVLCLHTSDQWVHARLNGRGRSDDRNERTISGRINWFHASVEPAIELLKESPLVRFHNIDGEQTIEQVHKDICSSLNIDG